MGNVSFHMPITVAMGKILLVKAISAYGQGLVFISDIVWITYCSLWQFLYILTKTFLFGGIVYMGKIFSLWPFYAWAKWRFLWPLL